MIDAKKIPLPYIKKSEYPGSDTGIRYMFRSVTVTNEESGEEEKIMRVFLWPEPYCLTKTDPELVVQRDFPLTEDGKREAVDWINREHAEHPERYENTGIRL
ncbi:MAG: hypothetical protein K6E18_09590 [Lachnospiraceae bacterium]|nr:hypothetical protein [Lachnospiraceae bacterium]